MELQAVAEIPFGTRQKKRLNRNGLLLFLMALPFVAAVIAFSYVPLFGWAYAFYNYKVGYALSHMEFVGFDNFIKIFHERREVFRVLRNTLVMSSFGILSSPFPVIFAILLNEIKSSKFKRFVQTVTTFPNFISWIIVFSLFFSIFSIDGLINTAIRHFHLGDGNFNLLGNNSAVWWFQWAAGTWKSLGWGAIIYLAAISGIDTELYDAAKVDGANRFKSILHITIPGLYSTYLVLLLLSVSNLLNNGLDQFFVFYNPLVADRIEVLDYYVYKIGIYTNDYSYATAIGMWKTLISVMLLFSVNSMAKRLRGESIF